MDQVQAPAGVRPNDGMRTRPALAYPWPGTIGNEDCRPSTRDWAPCGESASCVPSTLNEAGKPTGQP